MPPPRLPASTSRFSSSALWWPSTPQPPKEEEPAGPAEPPENLSTNLKWELSELENGRSEI